MPRFKVHGCVHRSAEHEKGLTSSAAVAQQGASLPVLVRPRNTVLPIAFRIFRRNGLLAGRSSHELAVTIDGVLVRDECYQRKLTRCQKTLAPRVQ
jgi:hypothetical protein